MRTDYPEILAPCGTWDSLEAAVKAGADAVYLGGDLFSARAFAGNFDTEELLRAIDYCHIFDVKIYLALNTLLKNTEIGMVKNYVEPFWRAGLDGVIVQDMGVAHVLKCEFPDLPLHASTQMSITSAHGAKFLKDMGFARVVPARELSLAEIRSIKEKVDIEIETFVHGAMCFAYSGKCLMSSYIGGRSGNRGRCAQPCRQRWKINNGDAPCADCYAMSLKDMCTLKDLRSLMEAGIDSFKIEGRMKKPEYTAQAVSSYKKIRDMILEDTGSERSGGTGKALVEEEMHLKDIYNRGGFSDGYYFRQNGPDMLALNRPNHSGVYVGKVSRVQPPCIYIKTAEDINPQDVLEFRWQKESGEDLPVLTAANGTAKGSELVLRGREFSRFKKGMEVYRIRNNSLIESIEKNIISTERQVVADAKVIAHKGEPLRISISSLGAEQPMAGMPVSITVSAETNLEKANKPVDAAVIKEKMQKTGGSNICLQVSCDIDDDVFIPMSGLNNLRRQAVDTYRKALAERYRRG